MELEARKAIIAALKASSTLNGANGVNSQWFKDVARGAFSYPYGLISLNTGVILNLASRVKGGDLRFVAKAVGKENELGGQQLKVDQCGALIRAALDEVTLTVDDPEYVWRCQIIQVVSFTENDGQTQFYHNGGIVRVRMSS